MKIVNSTFDDIPSILHFYEVATDYQKIKFPKSHWPKFERSLIESEIIEKRQWKMLVDGQIVCIWVTAFNDPKIWEEKDVDPAVYIHRIATNPAFKGQNLVSKLVTWAKDYAQTNGKLFVRMDTCGYNTKLIEHYKKSGFNLLYVKQLKDSTGLPAHYHGADVCFFQLKLGNTDDGL